MEEKEKIDRTKRYYLVNSHLYELMVNFRIMTINLYKLSEKSTLEDIHTESIILSNSLSLSGYTSYDELSENDMNMITYNCMGVIRKILNFKYEGNKNTMISTFDEYEKAYEKWREDLDAQVKAKEIKECTLENIILEEDVKEDILSTINFVKNIEKYKEMG